MYVRSSLLRRLAHILFGGEKTISPPVTAPYLVRYASLRYFDTARGNQPPHSFSLMILVWHYVHIPLGAIDVSRTPVAQTLARSRRANGYCHAVGMSISHFHFQHIVAVLTNDTLFFKHHGLALLALLR